MTGIQPIAFTAHLIPSYWSSRSPAVHRVALLCEWQGDALNRSMWRSFFEIRQVLFTTPMLCKSPSTPSVTSLLPCALTPLTSSHSGSLSCSPFHVYLPLWRREAFPQFPEDVVSAFYYKDYGWYLIRVKGILTLSFVDLVQMLLPDHMAQGTWGVVVNAEINLKQQSKHLTHLQFDPNVTSFL